MSRILPSPASVSDESTTDDCILQQHQNSVTTASAGQDCPAIRAMRQAAAGKRSKYIGRACQDCQRRKVKCSGEDICLHCRVRGKTCIYMPRGRRGRRQRADKAAAQTRTTDETSHAYTQLYPSDTPPSDQGLRERRETYPAETDQPLLAWENETDAYEPLEVSPRSISLSSQLQCLRELAQSSRRNPHMTPRNQYSTQNRTYPVELPRPAKVKALLDVYFRDLDSFFPFLDRDETETRLHATLAKLGYADDQYIVDVDPKSHSTVSLLCNMLAVAECFCLSDTQQSDLRPGWTIFLRGCKLNQYSSSLKYVDLDLIRYHALSAEYLMQSELLRAASQAISNATQLAMLARLNEQRSWGRISEREVRNRKTLWWTIYFLDRKISQRTGRPYIIRDSEVAVADFYPLTSMSPEADWADHYMQALVNLAKLWSQIWDSFFAAAAQKTLDWKEVEVMDTRIVVAQQDLPYEFTWETDLLDEGYIANGELEPHIRRRLALFIRLNLLRLMIRQNPLQEKSERRAVSQRLCVSLAAQTIEAIAAFADRYPSIIPCGFFFCTALLECVYHLIVSIRDAPTEEERSASLNAFQLSYQLLTQFSKTLDTAKRAIRALDSAVSLQSGVNLVLTSTGNENGNGNGNGNEMVNAGVDDVGGDIGVRGDISTPVATLADSDGADTITNMNPLYSEEDDPFNALLSFPFFGEEAESELAPGGSEGMSFEMGSPFWNIIFDTEVEGTTPAL